MKEINKSLKENQEKAIKQVKEMIQDLKTKTETIRKTQTKGILEIENMGKSSEAKKKNASVNNIIQENEERISSVEVMIEEIDVSVKENIESNKSLTQNIQDI